jgi:acetylornithine deacetylase/succinyl-diaminopimelate desuccinylase-like protein
VRAEFAIGEGGGFNIFIGSRAFFTVQVAEKGICWVRARFRGDPGHGSMPREDSAVIKLAEAVARLGQRGLPRRMTAVVSDFIDAIAKEQPAVARPIIRQLLSPGLASVVLKRLPDRSVARGLAAMLGNTASPTVLRAGDKTNVIPGVAEVHIDGRTLPGQTTADFLRELKEVLGPEVELDVMRELPPVVTEPRESGLWDTIHEVLREREPDAAIVPYLLPGFTDAKAFTQLGARWYGFAPVKMPPGMRFADLFHGHDERIPVAGTALGHRGPRRGHHALRRRRRRRRVILDAHAHLDPRLLDLGPMLAKLDAAGVQRVGLIPTMNDPLPATPHGLLTVMRHAMCHRPTRPLAQPSPPRA